MDKHLSSLSQLIYCRRYVLTEGKEANIKIIEVNNGKIRFLLNESKALDISQLWVDGINMSFVSKNGLVYENLPFLRRFEGGMLYTCGLDSIGGREGYELHGTLHTIPAKINYIKCDDKEIIVQGDIIDSALFGKNLILRRTIKTSVLSDKVSIEDVLINAGSKDENYCLLYHINFGYPMLDENTTINLEYEHIEPRSPYAKERINDRTTFLVPVDNEEERCYFIKQKEPLVKITNTKLKKEVILKYSNDSLPHLVQWNSNASYDYALGIEPTTTKLDDKFNYKTIKVNEEIKFNIELTFINI